jgi:hypothetical protein
MAVARVVTFEDIDAGHMEDLKGRMNEGDAPEGMNPKELLVLHDPGADKSLAIVLFETEDDYRTGDEILNNMPTEDTPGRRVSVERYDVAIHRTM